MQKSWCFLCFLHNALLNKEEVLEKKGDKRILYLYSLKIQSLKKWNTWKNTWFYLDSRSKFVRKKELERQDKSSAQDHYYHHHRYEKFASKLVALLFPNTQVSSSHQINTYVSNVVETTQKERSRVEKWWSKNEAHTEMKWLSCLMLFCSNATENVNTARE